MPNTSFKFNRWIVGGALAVIAAVVLVACGGGDANKSSSAIEPSAAHGETAAALAKSSSTPPVSWNPSSLSVAIVQGQSRTVKVDLVARDNISSATLQITPELQPYLQLSRTTTGPLQQGQKIQITLFFRIPLTTTLGALNGTIQLARSGEPRSVLAIPLPIQLNVLSSTIPGLPPDPGPAGMTTLEGIDSDRDGVRDDVQRYIAINYPHSERTRRALTQIARASQQTLLAAARADKSATINAGNQVDDGVSCLIYVESLTEGAKDDTLAKLTAIELNTLERSRAFMEAERILAHQSSESPRDPREKCAFDPDVLPN